MLLIIFVPKLLFLTEISTADIVVLDLLSWQLLSLCLSCFDGFLAFFLFARGLLWADTFCEKLHLLSHFVFDNFKRLRVNKLSEWVQFLLVE